MMKKKLILSFFCVALGFGVVKAQDLPDKKETLKTVTKVNDYFMKKYADYRTPSFVKNVTRPSNIWTRGVYYEGLMALYSVYPRDDYYKYAVDWSNYHEWGFRNGTTTRNADDYCASQTYIDLYNICPDPERIRKVKANIDMLVNTPQVNDWWWIDAIQMGMPVFADSLKISQFNLFTSMRTTDDLTHGISYFNAELLRLRQLISSLNGPTLIILDEILKGTNSLDKLNGSRLFLEYISEKDVTGVIATHDLELSKMSERYPDRFHNYCFEIELGTDITYSYKITQGTAKNQNATFLLQNILKEM